MSGFKIYSKSILIPVAIGGVVGLIISNFMDYGSLEKPILAPPGIAFPIIWTILYILMGISYGILESNSNIDCNVNLIYYSQLFLNALWPIFFFVFKWRLFSFIWLLLLVFLVLLMVIRFYLKDTKAGILQIPYLLWTIFASYLNLFTYILNK